ncbi:MAG: class I adenylate-forming enzyme family protein [Acidimicrobiales bacterium]
MAAHRATVEILEPADAESRQRRAAGALAAAGAGPGDRVAFCLPSSADLLCAVLGAARTGVIPVLLNATLTPAERDLLVADAEPVLTVADRRALGALDEGSPVELAPFPLTRPMHYTSGTTGRPKGVTTGLWDEATAAAVFDDEAEQWGFSAEDRHMVCSPMYHTVAVRFAGGTLLRGGSLAILSRYDASTALEVLRRLQPTTAFLVPTHLQRLLALDDLGPDERFGSLRLLAHAGAPCPPALKRAAMARVADGALWEFYGSTEGQFTACSPAEWLERPGTVGRARAGRRLSIAPTTGPDAGTVGAGGPVGTIWCAAPPFARFSYWGDDEATAAAWRGDAFTVGDLGSLDAEGYLFLSGRRHDLIITGGVNVYPAEVEAVLDEVAGVDEVAVFALPDEAWGQRVCAAVVGRPGLKVDALRAAAEGRLAPYKRPKQYLVVRDLPHTATGKLLRRAVPEHLGLSAGD